MIGVVEKRRRKRSLETKGNRTGGRRLCVRCDTVWQNLRAGSGI